MFSKNKSRHRYESAATYPNYATLPLPVGPDMKMGVSSRPSLERENSGEKWHQPNRFFEGLLYLLPLSIVFWIVIIWGVCNLLL